MSAYGIHQIPADLPFVIDSYTALTDTARLRPASTDANAATAEPSQTKNMLAATRTQHAAGLRFLRGQIERGEHTQTARRHMERIGECVEALGRAVRSGAANEDWRRAVHASGRKTDMSILLRPSHETMPAAFSRSADG